MKVQVLHDSDNIFKTYYNTVTKQYVEANSTKYSGLPYIQEQCFPNQASAVGTLARMRHTAEIIEGGYKESETVVEPVSDEELLGELSKLSMAAGMNIPEEVLNPLPPRVRGQKVADKDPDEFERAYPPENFDASSIRNAVDFKSRADNNSTVEVAREDVKTMYMKACAKLSVAKKKEKEMLLSWIDGFESAVSGSVKEELLKIKKEFIND